MSPMLDARTAEYRAYIDRYLADFYRRFHTEPQKPLFEAVEYSLLAPGKRLRPVFTFEFLPSFAFENSQKTS